MEFFPIYLSPDELQRFPDYIFRLEMRKIRSRIHDFILSQTKGGFDLRSSTDDKGQYAYKTIDEKIITQVQKELHDFGWETKLAFGGMTMFVFDPEDIPEEVKNLPPDDSIETIDE